MKILCFQGSSTGFPLDIALCLRMSLQSGWICESGVARSPNSLHPGKRSIVQSYVIIILLKTLHCPLHCSAFCYALFPSAWSSCASVHSLCRWSFLDRWSNRFTEKKKQKQNNLTRGIKGCHPGDAIKWKEHLQLQGILPHFHPKHISHPITFTRGKEYNWSLSPVQVKASSKKTLHKDRKSVV